MISADQKIFTLAEGSHTHGYRNEDGYFDEANASLGKFVGEALAKFYPGHPWGISSEIEHGIVKICIQGFTQWQSVIHVNSLKGDPSLKKVMRLAGELLERLNMPRNGFKMDAWRAANQKMPQHFYRNAKPPA